MKEAFMSTGVTTTTPATPKFLFKLQQLWAAHETLLFAFLVHLAILMPWQLTTLLKQLGF